MNATDIKKEYEEWFQTLHPETVAGDLTFHRDWNSMKWLFVAERFYHKPKKNK